MTTTRKNPTAPRTVYEIRPAQGQAVQVEAASAGDLAQHLASAAGLDPYSSRAAAHVLHVLRGTITAPTVSARRLGVLEFRPDAPAQTPAPASRRASKAPQAIQGHDTPPPVPATPSAVPGMAETHIQEETR